MAKEINQASDKWVILLNKIIFMPQKLITSFISFDDWRAKTRIILIFLLLFSPFSITFNLHLYKVDTFFYNKRIMRVKDATCSSSATANQPATSRANVTSQRRK
jgi:hypothetical protein